MQEACNLFEDNDVVLATVGDSFVRQMTQVLLAVMVDDYQRGGMIWWEQPEDQRQICQCDAPFDDVATTCRIFSMAYYGGDPKRICPSWTRMRVIFHEKTVENVTMVQEGSPTAGHNLTTFLHDLSVARPFVYLNFGIHLDFNFTKGKTGYLEPIWEMMEQATLERRRRTAATAGSTPEMAGATPNRKIEEEIVGKSTNSPTIPAIEGDDEALAATLNPFPPHILLASAAYPGPKKDIYRYPNQARGGVFMWNYFLKEYQAQHNQGSSLIDFAPISDHSYSADGTHFLQDTNVILAQMVLNHIAAQIASS